MTRRFDRDDGDQWNDPDRLESDDGADVSAAGFAAGVVAFSVLVYLLWIGAHFEAVLALWAIAALGVVGMRRHGQRGGR